MRASGIRPHLTVSNATAALDFYQAAFGATLPDHPVSRTPDGAKVMHAMVDIDGTLLMLHDEFPDHGVLAPQAGAKLPFVLHLDVADVDAAVDRAASAGARATMPAADQFWGERYAQILDPFGYTWSFGGPLKGGSVAGCVLP
jgi:PhnB protein